MRWSEFAADQPSLARVGLARLIEPGVVLVGSIRRDGTVRISPVEPFILDGELLLSMLWGSRKAADLLRDPRILVHSTVAGRSGEPGEFKVRGAARVVDEPAAQRLYADAVSASLGWRPQPGRFHLFAIGIESVTFIRYDDATGRQHVTLWPAGREFIRDATSATSLAAPEPVRDILTVGGTVPHPVATAPNWRT